MTLEAIDPTILGPAMLAGLLVLSTHVPLGRQVLARGIIFIDLAIAQIAALGVILADAFDWHAQWQIQACAITASLLGALLLNACERRWPQVQEALIGVAFVLAATGGLLLLAQNPHAAERLTDLLSGQILWVSYDQLSPVAPLYAAVLALWYGLPGPPQRLRFYLLFAVTITASVQLVGVYLVFASLIIPALTVRRYDTRRGLVAGYLIGMTGYTIGLVGSALFDLPSGPLVVWTLAAAAILTGFMRRRA